MAQDLGMGIDLRISPSFHPQVIASMEEFDADTQPVLQQAVDAFTSVYEGLGKVHDAKAAAQANTAWPENRGANPAVEFGDDLLGLVRIHDCGAKIARIGVRDRGFTRCRRTQKDDRAPLLPDVLGGWQPVFGPSQTTRLAIEIIDRCGFAKDFFAAR